MKILTIVLSLILITPFAFADRVCIEKATGKLIEYQSDSSIQVSPEIKANRLESLKQTAIRAGYQETDIEVKEITPQEWTTINQKWIIEPAIAEQAAKEAEQVKKEEAVKTEMGWTDAQWTKIKAALQ